MMRLWFQRQKAALLVWRAAPKDLASNWTSSAPRATDYAMVPGSTARATLKRDSC